MSTEQDPKTTDLFDTIAEGLDDGGYQVERPNGQVVVMNNVEDSIGDGEWYRVTIERCHGPAEAEPEDES